MSIEPGLHFDISADAYHQDPAPVPSLSSSIAKILIDASPRHAWCAHPRLNPDWQDDGGSRRMDLGSLAHKLVLGKGREIAVIDFDDYRTKEAKAQRDAAIAAGKIPTLAADLRTAENMAEALVHQLQQIPGAELFFIQGEPEAVMLWQERKVWCRSLIDWLSPDRRAITDYKTISGSAHPQAVARRLFDMGYHIQAAFYERGMHTLGLVPEGEMRFRFVFQEVDPPYLCSVVELDPAAMVIGRKQVAAAIALWRRCAIEGQWPGLPALITRIDLPPWIERAWLEREIADETARDILGDPFLALSPWVPPRPADKLMEPL